MGQQVYQAYNVYVAGGDSGIGGTRSWSGSLVSLLPSGAYGRCIPPNV